MNSQSLFVAGLRLFGVWELLRCIDHIIEWYDMNVGFYKTNVLTPGASYTHGSAYFVIGLYLLGGAPHIVRFFYPPVAPASESAPSSTPAA